MWKNNVSDFDNWNRKVAVAVPGGGYGEERGVWNGSRVQV